jgi:RNA polymerase sigma-70 factor (ECF subfamily)
MRSEPEDGADVPARSAELVGAIAARQDRAAFAALFGFYAPRVKTMLMRLGTEATLAEDIAQEALLVVWRKAATYDAARASVAAWIFTIARNRRIDHLRSDKRAALYELYEAVEPEAPELPDAALDGTERDARMRVALGQLSEAQMQVVEFSFFENRAHGDIARLLGIPLGTVKSRLRLALARLRDVLGDPT